MLCPAKERRQLPCRHISPVARLVVRPLAQWLCHCGLGLEGSWSRASARASICARGVPAAVDTRIEDVISCVQAAPQAAGVDGGRDSPTGGNGPLTPEVGLARAWRIAYAYYLCRPLRSAAVPSPSRSPLPLAPAATCLLAPAVAEAMACICCALPLPAACAARQSCLPRYAEQSLICPFRRSGMRMPWMEMWVRWRSATPRARGRPGRPRR